MAFEQPGECVPSAGDAALCRGPSEPAAERPTARAGHRPPGSRAAGRPVPTLCGRPSGASEAACGQAPQLLGELADVGGAGGRAVPLAARHLGMAGWTGLAPLLACLLLLCPGISPACPAACRCSLGEVDCSSRALRWVPENLPGDARAVRLAYNRIAILGDHAFPAQPALQNLSLHANVLVSIHSQALAGLGALRELDLSNNYLTVLAAETFLPLLGLATLNLGSNQLAQLPPAVLSALPGLQELFLHSNALRSLRASVFPSLPALRSLTLKGNPWVCTCEIQPLFLWLVDNRDKIQEENLIQCRFPEHLNRYPLTAIGTESFSHCQAGPLLPRDYAFFLLVGPASFLASITVCLLLGSLAVAYDRLLKELRS